MNTLYVLLWWLIIQLFGLAALPLTFGLFRWLPDRGYTASKAVGLLLVSYLLWVGASAQLLRNDSGGILLALLLVAALSLWLYRRWQAPPAQAAQLSLPAFLLEQRRLVIVSEVLFSMSFVLWVVLRAYAAGKIMSTGGEKFMEIAFLNGILRSPTFPPLDPWLSGFSISYYYFGYVMMAIVTRLSGAPAGVGFDLYDALLFALTAQGAFGVVYNLIAGSRRLKSERQARASQALGFGLLGALFVVLMGNLEGVLEGLHAWGKLPSAFWKWINIPDLESAPVSGSFFPGYQGGWWWWRGSRVLADLDFSGQIVPVAPISEFPFFSFLLGDNHPHVLALPFVLLAILLALNLLRRQALQRGAAPLKENETASQPAAQTLAAWWNPIAVVFDGQWEVFLLYALALGALGFLNTWDFPIYVGLATLAYGAGVYAQMRRLERDLWLSMGALAFAWLVAGILLYVFFYVGFSSQASGILPYIFPPTRLSQYFIQFGPFLFIMACFLVIYLLGRARADAPRLLLKSFVGGWLLIAAVCAGSYALVLVGAWLGYAFSQAFQETMSDPALVTAFGGLSFSQAMTASLKARLLNPWLSLTLTALLGLALAALRWQPSGKRLLPGDARRQGDETASTLSPAASDLFAFLLILIGLALTLSVEFFYLRDIFGYRINTVFKFYFQGWAMMALASAYGLWWLLYVGERIVGQAVKWSLLSLSVLLIALAMVYPLMAFWTRVQGFTTTPNLDGASEVAAGNPDDWAAIEWLNANVAGAVTLLEAPGNSYDYEGRISAFTGLPAVLGWSVHEQQWRGTFDEQALRLPDIAEIYSTKDVVKALDLLDKWQVRYVVLGATEKNYIQRVCSEPGRGCNLSTAVRKFEAHFTPVFSQGQTTIYAVP